ncbi:type II toxin-antitoxin system HicB family antitoxin (plasmid) [Acaryochloris marina S15]|nr:type II toxin-antitoxin system HicB family antitoxin [Acaryochloris marina S15]
MRCSLGITALTLTKAETKGYKYHPLSTGRLSRKSQFQEAIDEYLTDCAENAIEPEHSFKGSFNIRPGTQLHRQAAIAAQQRGINLNALVTEALENYLQPSK